MEVPPNSQARITTYDALTEESRRACLKLAPSAIVTPQRYGDSTYFHIRLESQSKYVRIGYREYVFLSLLDGKTTTARALAESSQALQRDALSENEADRLIEWLLENGLVRFNVAQVDKMDEAAQPSGENKQEANWLQRLNPFWIKVPLTKLLGEPNRILDALLPWTRWCFHPACLLLMLSVIAAGLIAASTYSSELMQSTEGLFVSENWLALIFTWIVLKIIHELSHAICCRFYGGTVTEAGLVMILFVPMAYVDVTSSWAFAERWKRMAVAAAGMFSELFVASIALFLWFQVDSPVLKHHLINIMVTASVATVLFNANPLMRFDGYFLLSDWLRLPNLYAAGGESTQQWLHWLIYGQDETGTCVETRERRWVVRIYGLLAVVWKVVICISLTLAASVMLGGWGILLAAMGVVSMIGLPVLKGLKDFLRRAQSQRHQAVRALTVSALLLMTAVGAWYWLPNPFPAHVPCVVDFVTSAKVRAGATGFVVAVEVSEGQAVKRGDVLLRLENRELSSRISQIESDLELHRVREKIAIDQREMAAAQIALEDQSAAVKKLKELQQQADELVIRAPNDGIVIASQLHHLLGTHVEVGDVLLVVGNDRLKEIVFSIATSDSSELAQWEDVRLPIRIGQQGRQLATIDRVEPRASDQLPHPALGVHNGGPLTIRNIDGDEEPRLARSRFIARAKLDASLGQHLFAGETGVAYLRRPNQTLGAYLWVSGQDWLRQQMELTQATIN